MPIPPSSPASRPRRVAILTADVGEGHLAAARVLADELRAQDVEVVVVDALAAFGRPLRFLLRDAYRAQLRATPWVFGALFWLSLHIRFLRAGGRIGLAVLGSRGLERALCKHQPDVVVSTYPAATSVLGGLRRRGRIAVPACATITDLGGVAFWAHPHIDTHLVMHPGLVRAVEREAGCGSTRLVRPLVASAFFERRSRQSACLALGLAPERRLVVVSGGGWGVGDLEGATREAMALAGTTVICLAGRDESTRARLESVFAGNGHVRVLGFTDRMPELLAAANVLVHTTGGVTCLEALASGCPVVAYGAPAGHGPTLARAMSSLGVASHVRKRGELRAALVAALPADVPDVMPSAASEVLEARVRSTGTRVRHRRLAAVAVVAGVGAATLFAGASERAFALVAERFDLAPLSRISTPMPEVGLVIETSQRGAPPLARLIAAAHGSASFAFARPPATPTAQELARLHDGVIVALASAGIDDWIGTADHLFDLPLADRERPFFVLAPASGLSAGQYLLARLAGARLVDGHAAVHAAPWGPRHFERGSILVAALDARASGHAELERLLVSLNRNGLHPVSLAALSATHG